MSSRFHSSRNTPATDFTNSAGSRPWASAARWPSLFTIRLVAIALEELLAGMDDAAIEAMVRIASPPALLAALAQATGDLSLLRDDLRPAPGQLRDPGG